MYLLLDVGLDHLPPMTQTRPLISFLLLDFSFHLNLLKNIPQILSVHPRQQPVCPEPLCFRHRHEDSQLLPLWNTRLNDIFRSSKHNAREEGLGCVEHWEGVFIVSEVESVFENSLRSRGKDGGVEEVEQSPKFNKIVLNRGTGQNFKINPRQKVMSRGSKGRTGLTHTI